MKAIRLLISVVLMSTIAVPLALAQDMGGGVNTQSPSFITSGSYGPGSYGSGFFAQGIAGPGSYGPGSYGPGVGAYTGPTTPFGIFSAGGAAAGTSAAPSASVSRSR